MLDKETVDLRYTEQLADSEQTTALAYFMRYLLERTKSAQTVRESVSEIETLFEKKGWQAFCSSYVPAGWHGRGRRKYMRYLTDTAVNG